MCILLHNSPPVWLYEAFDKVWTSRCFKLLMICLSRHPYCQSVITWQKMFRIISLVTLGHGGTGSPTQLLIAPERKEIGIPTLKRHLNTGIDGTGKKLHFCWKFMFFVLPVDSTCLFRWLVAMLINNTWALFYSIFRLWNRKMITLTSLLPDWKKLSWL